MNTYLFIAIFFIILGDSGTFFHGLDTVVSWAGRTSEIEFVLEIDGKIIPAEVRELIQRPNKA
jgi:hypothetical protein